MLPIVSANRKWSKNTERPRRRMSTARSLEAVQIVWHAPDDPQRFSWGGLFFGLQKTCGKLILSNLTQGQDPQTEQTHLTHIA
jgi:hypothetical protein